MLLIRQALWAFVMLHLCFAGGLRVSELIGTRVVDVKLQPEPSVLIRQNAVNLFESRWHTILGVPHERLDSREANVSGSSAIFGRCFQVVEKVRNECSIDVL
jgi:hypothetical protein